MFPETEPALRLVMEMVLSIAIPIPDRLVMKRPIVISTNGEAKYSSNYRPLTCLNIQYNFAMAVLADSLAIYVEVNSAFPGNPRYVSSIGKGSFGHVMVSIQ